MWIRWWLVRGLGWVGSVVASGGARCPHVRFVGPVAASRPVSLPSRVSWGSRGGPRAATAKVVFVASCTWAPVLVYHGSELKQFGTDAIRGAQGLDDFWAEGFAPRPTSAAGLEWYWESASRLVRDAEERIAAMDDNPLVVYGWDGDDVAVRLIAPA